MIGPSRPGYDKDRIGKVSTGPLPRHLLLLRAIEVVTYKTNKTGVAGIRLPVSAE